MLATSLSLILAAIGLAGGIALSANTGAAEIPLQAADEGTKQRDGDIKADARYQANLAKEGGKDKIVGGRRAKPGENPETVAVVGNGRICTGTLISADVVLTAAHCVCSGINEAVVFGESTQGTRIHVLKSVSRVPCKDKPLTISDVRNVDLGLLFLEPGPPLNPHTPRSPKPIALASSQEIDAATSLRVVGFGKTSDPNQPAPGIKFIVDVPVASPSCSGKVTNTPDTQYYGCAPPGELVAGRLNLGMDTCGGDSGGPAFIQRPDGSYLLAAATSRGVADRDCGDGGIYERVDASALAWLRAQGASVKVDGETSPLTSAVPAVTSGARVVKNAMISTAGSERFLEWSDKGVAKRLAIANPEVISSLAHAHKATVTYKQEGDSTVSIAKFEPKSMESLLESVKKLQRDSRYTSLVAQANYFGEVTRSAMVSGAIDSEQNRAAVAEQSRLTEQKIVSAFLTTPSTDTAARKKLVAAYMEHRANESSKAVYGRDDRFRPLNYRQIYENSQGGAAIWDKGLGRYICSGVLIGMDYVLTASHCMAGLTATDVKVVFHYEKNLQDVDFPVDEYAVDGIERDGADSDLDYIVVRLKKNGSNKSAGDVWHPQCISTARQRRDFPLYVVGHPEGVPRTIADNGFVIFPFQATDYEFAQLQMLVEAELEGDPNRAERLSEFLGSYVRRQGGPFYENYSLRWSKYPVIGADTDTFHGNSGSPVYSRTNHGVIGVLIEGEPDVSRPWVPGWRRHEAILAITRVVDDLDAKIPDWQTRIAACIRRD